jgi:hypothetical protein
MLRIYIDTPPVELKDVGILSNNDDMILGIGSVYYTEFHSQLVDILSFVINGFYYKKVVCIDNDYYTANVNYKIKDFRGALGKFGLLELKKIGDCTRKIIFEREKYYIDIVNCSKEIPKNVIDKIFDCLFDGLELFMCIGDKQSTWPIMENDKFLLDGFFNKPSFFKGYLRVFIGLTLEGKYFIFFIGARSIILPLQQKIKSLSLYMEFSGFEKIFNDHTHIYPYMQPALFRLSF